MNLFLGSSISDGSKRIMRWKRAGVDLHVFGPYQNRSPRLSGSVGNRLPAYVGSSPGRAHSLTKQSTMKPMEPMSGMKPMSPMKPMEPMKATVRWWPEELGEQPNSAGAQNEMRYAFFGDQHRLAVDTGDGKVQVYDTGDHRISGRSATPEQQRKKDHVYEQAGESRFGDVEIVLTTS